jgi:uncharacterized protein (TIGR03435 family)
VRFDKATVQRCPDDATVPSGQQLSMANASDSIAADRIRPTCRTVESLIAMAYVQYADGLTHSRWAVGSTGITVTGGASWLRTDTYAVEAVAPVNTSREMMLGPMLQTLLKDRFRLEVHRKNRDVPVYNLTGAGNWYAKLKPLEFKEGTCTKPDTVPESPETTPGAGQRLCASRVTSTGTGSRLDLEGTTLGGLANFLTAQPFIDRRVRDRIGYPGEYDFRLEFNRAADDQAHESTARVALRRPTGTTRDASRAGHRRSRIPCHQPRTAAQ